MINSYKYMLYEIVYILYTFMIIDVFVCERTDPGRQVRMLIALGSAVIAGQFVYIYICLDIYIYRYIYIYMCIYMI